MADRPDYETQAAVPELPEDAEVSPPVDDRRARRRRWLGLLVAAVAGIGLLALLYHLLVGVRHVSTDNAYVGADTAQVTPLVAGQVQDVRVENTQAVHRGDVLVVIDPRDARIAADRTAADLSQAQRQLQQTTSTGGALEGQLAARAADVDSARAQAQSAEATFDRTRVDLDRRQKLSASGAVSGDELTSARNAFLNARAQLAVAKAAIVQAQANQRAARASLAANQALTAGPAAQNPDVLAARARHDAAQLDLDRTVIRAPIDGVVAQRQVQVGQRVAAGTPVMTIVPLSAMYVDANFKEGQLTKVKPGQKARLTSDLYGGGVVYHGTVVGFAGGTGSAFALIPAQNATGNWIKVVQRLPVRIALDPKELQEHPLRVGLSMDADVDVAGD